MRKFDSNVQILKYKVLREVARHTWEGNDIFSMFNEIAKEVVRKDHIPMRCCIYKDRAIVAERIRIALGGNKKQPGVVEVIDIACDDCPPRPDTWLRTCVVAALPTSVKELAQRRPLSLMNT